MPDYIKQFLTAPLRRELSIGNINKEARTVELAFSSDAPIDRWGVNEVLSHEKGACDLTRLNNNANLLFNHDPNRCLGVVESASIANDGKGRAVVRFGKSEQAEKAWQDVLDGILTKVSVGYRIQEVKLTEESADGPDTYTVTKWQPYEISLVTIPADDSVGVGRNNNKENFMTAELKENPAPVQSAAPAAAPVAPQVNVEAERAAGRSTETQRVNAILEAGDKYGLRDLAVTAIKDGKSVDETRALFLDKINERNKKVADGSRPIGLSSDEARGFSFLKLIRSLVDPTDKVARDAAAFELEACAAAAEQVKHRALKGTMIPVDVLKAPFGERADSAVSVKTGTGYTGTGGATIETHLLAGSFIEVLRNKCILMQLGVQLGGLVGNIDIPKQSGQTSGYWIGEDDAATRDSIDFGLVQLTPHTVATLAEITRKMLMQPSIGVEGLLRNDIALGIARAIDKAGFYGDGTNNAPTGIKNTNGVGSVALATAGKPTFEELVSFETKLANANADIGNIEWVIAPSIRGYAKTTRRLSTATDSATLWEPGNTLNGYKTNVTNQITAGDLFFGNFLDLLIGLWGGLEITVDPFSNSARGRIRLVAMQDTDFNVRHAESFVFGA